MGRLLTSREPDYLFPDTAPEMLTESDVLTRVCETLDRKLFESTIVKQIGEVGARVTDFGDAVDAVLSIVGHVLDYSIGAVALTRERIFAVRPVGPVGRLRISDMVGQMRESMPQIGDAGDQGGEIQLVTFESAGTVTEDPSPPLQTFVSMPLWSNGQAVALLALASFDRGAFGEQDLQALRIIENTLAAVVDNARLHEQIARRGAVEPA